MERDPQLPAAPEATAKAPNTKRAAFLEKWNKRVKRPPAETAQPAAEAQTKTPEAPQLPERKSFGKNIVGLLFGGRERPERQQAVPAAPEAQPAQPQTPEQTPQYDRATRMRRLARVIIANVLGQAGQEPLRAQKQGEAQPLNTQPLTEAAQHLQSAATTLDATINQAQRVSAAPNNSGVYDSQPQSERSVLPVEQDAGDRIDRRLRRLEAAAEDHRAASVVAVGLGVLAVLLTGTEYFGRKRADRKIRSSTREQFAAQEAVMAQQRTEFDELKREHVVGMNRAQRSNYYERLSTFTHQQAERTRETGRELQEVVIAHTPEAAAAASASGDIFERRPWRPRQPERAPVPAAAEPEREPLPLMRVETAERTERQPGQQTGSAGTGFFGGGGGGIAAGTGPSDLNPPQPQADPHSLEARKLEALRRAQQARLQQNAWLYGAALIAALGTLFIVALVIG